MAYQTITGLPFAISLSGTEQLEIVQSGTSRRTTAQAIANLATSGGTITSITAQSPLSGGTITSTGTIGLQSQGVTNSYLAPMATNTVKANVTGSTAQPTDATVSQVLDTFSATEGSTLYRGSSGWAALTAGANNTLFTSNGTASDPSYRSLSAVIDAVTGVSGSVQGAILYRNASVWTALAPGAYGSLLRSRGNAANPDWFSGSGTGTVTQIDTGTGLAGGPITTTGTISIDVTGVTAGSYGSASNVPTYTVNAQGQLTSASNTAIAISASAITSGVLAIARGGTATGTTPTNGQLLIGNGTGYSLSTITAGTGITITNASGSITPSITNTAVATGSFGSSSSVATFTVNQQGQLTAAASVPINAIALTTGSISTAPTNDTDIANKLYVDSIAQGLNFHAACNYATTTSNVYTVTYNNGSSGVGATLTNAGALAAFAVDGVTLTGSNIGNRILIKNQANGAYNGVYTLTTVGSGSVAWVLTRATDYDSSGTGTNEIDAGDFMYVLAGSTLANTSWVQQTPLPITVGTTALVFLQFGAQITYTAGTGLTLAANQFSITNTAVTANSYGSASTVPTYTVNAQGQLTAASNTSIAIDAGAVTTGTLAVARGGTNIASYTIGDLIYASGTTTLAKLPDVAVGSVVVSGGVGAAPAYSATPTVTSLTASTSLTSPIHNSSTTLSLQTGGTTGLYIDASQNVGIGTSSPSQRLTISDTGSGLNRDLAVRNGDATNYHQLAIGYNASTLNSGVPANSLFMLAEKGGGYGTVGGLSLGTIGAAPTVFINNGAETMRIDSSGNVGIGNSSPGTYGKLEVTGTGYVGTSVRSTDASGVAAAFAAYSSSDARLTVLTNHPLLMLTNNTERMRIDSSGNLLVGTTSLPIAATRVGISGASGVSVGVVSLVNTSASTKKWSNGPDANGNFIVFNDASVGMYLGYGNNAWTASSDERAKTDLVPIENAAAKVSSLRAVTGRFKTDEEGTSRAFLIAQDVQAVLPEAVDATNPDKLGVQYTDVIPLLVAAIKELSAKVTALESR